MSSFWVLCVFIILLSIFYSLSDFEFYLMLNSFNYYIMILGCLICIGDPNKNKKKRRLADMSVFWCGWAIEGKVSYFSKGKRFAVELATTNSL